MFADIKARHSQNAYVTTDLDRAMTIWRDQYGVPSFYVFANDAPGLESSHPYRMKIALANVGGVEIELIEPLHGSAPLHAEPLPTDGSFAMRFHHIALRVDGILADFEAHLAALDPAAHPVVWSGGMGDVMRYAYTDERQTLGHYVEHVWFDAAFYAQMAGGRPRLPGAVTMSETGLNFRDLGGLPATGWSHSLRRAVSQRGAAQFCARTTRGVAPYRICHNCRLRSAV